MALGVVVDHEVHHLFVLYMLGESVGNTRGGRVSDTCVYCTVGGWGNELSLGVVVDDKVHHIYLYLCVFS